MDSDPSVPYREGARGSGRKPSRSPELPGLGVALLRI